MQNGSVHVSGGGGYPPGGGGPPGGWGPPPGAPPRDTQLTFFISHATPRTHRPMRARRKNTDSNKELSS